MNGVIRERFEALRRKNEAALVGFFTAGFPTLPASLQAMRTAAANGADLIELGVPFSDPVADGPTIQRSSQQALAGGARLEAILDAVTPLALPVPLSLMSYLNPLEARGRDATLDRIAAAGIRGLIVPDLPLEEAASWLEPTDRRGIELTLLVAPTSSARRMQRIAEMSRGFVYHVSVTGTTGTRRELPPDLPRTLHRLRQWTRTPVCVGFGISSPEHVRGLRDHADGVVVGSRLVEALERGDDLAALTRSLKQATVRSHEEHESC